MESTTKRNLVILAAAAGVGFFVWRKWLSAPVDDGPVPRAVGPAAPEAQAAAAAGTSSMLSLNSQPAVRKGELVGTRTQVLVTTKLKGYRYFKISSTTAQGVREFKSTVNGFFTGRLLSTGGKLYAEVRPA